MKLFLVPKERVNDLWAQVEHFVASYVERSFGRYLLEDVKGVITDGTFQLWIAVEDERIKASAMTQVFEFPQLRELQIIMCSGSDRGQWFDFIKRIEDYASAIGAKRISAISRLGWRRDMQSLGYKHTHDYLEKVL